MKKIPAFLHSLLNKAKSLFMDNLNPEQVLGQSQAISNMIGTSGSGPETSPDAQDTPVKKISRMNIISAVFNGAGIGLLLGILWSLSVSPVIGGVIATLSSLLALFLGLSEKYIDPLKSIRIGAFGIAAVAGVLLGLYIRTNDPFTPTMRDKMDQYLAIGYSEEQARAFITKSIESDTGKTRREANVLYSGTVDAGACDDLQYAKEGSPEIINTFKSAGGAWRELAETFEADLPGDIIGKALISVRDVFCNLPSSDGKVNMTNLSSNISDTDSLERIEQVLLSSGGNWQAIESNISGNIPESERKQVYLSIIKVFAHEN
jgi:hypothetical protein